MDKELEINFFDSEGNWIAQGEQIKNWDHFPIIMKLQENNEKINHYSINFNTNFRLNQEVQLSETRSF